jgi:putative DNA methylase
LWKGKKVTYRKKLIEVALPLDAINAASAREKSIRHGHSSTLHLWWAHLQSRGRMGAGSG